MKKYLVVALIGLAFGMISGLLSSLIVHLDSDVFNGFTTSDHWFDCLVLLAIPGHIFTWMIFNPSDSYLGDDSAYWIPITLFNGLFWMIFTPALFFYFYLAMCIPKDIKLAYQNWKQYGSAPRKPASKSGDENSA